MSATDVRRAAILAALSRATIRTVEVAGEVVHIRGLTGAERVQLQGWMKAATDGGEPLADYRIAALGVCNEDGVRLFPNADDLANVDGVALGRLALAVLEASGLGADAAEGARGN
jgi:hypothetical protein